jgi:universal stress protein A
MSSPEASSRAPNTMAPIKQILVATDFESSQPALDWAVDLAEKLGAHLTIMHAYELSSYYDAVAAFSDAETVPQAERVARERLKETMRAIRITLPQASAVLCCGAPWQQILAAAVETHADLVIVGTHGRRGVSHMLLGSVAEKVIRSSPVPVLSVRGGPGP